MNTFMDILKELLPVIGTGLFTFLITKYSYHKNVPLDKMEITYSRLYYPIYRLTQDNKNTSEVIVESEKYLKKYGKYADRSTVTAFVFLYDNQDDKNAYANYRNNIFNICIRLRRRLGYLEPSLLNMYTYSAPKDKSLLNILFEVMFMYISLMLFSVSSDVSWMAIVALIFWIAFVGFVIEIIKMCGRGIKRLFKRRKTDF